MAKKSSKKSVNKLLDLILFVIAGGMFGFLAMPYISNKVTSVLGDTINNISGYQLLDFEADSGLATIILLLIIFASLLALLSIVKFCFDSHIIKNKSVGKIAGFGVVVMALAILVVCVVAMIVVPDKCSSYSFGGFVSAGNYANWFTLILTTGVYAMGLVVSFYSIKK